MAHWHGLTADSVKLRQYVQDDEQYRWCARSQDENVRRIEKNKGAVGLQNLPADLLYEIAILLASPEAAGEQALCVTSDLCSFRLVAPACDDAARSIIDRVGVTLHLPLRARAFEHFKQSVVLDDYESWVKKIVVHLHPKFVEQRCGDDHMRTTFGNALASRKAYRIDELEDLVEDNTQLMIHQQNEHNKFHESIAKRDFDLQAVLRALKHVEHVSFRVFNFMGEHYQHVDPFPFLPHLASMVRRHVRVSALYFVGLDSCAFSATENGELIINLETPFITGTRSIVNELTRLEFHDLRVDSHGDETQLKQGAEKFSLLLSSAKHLSSLVLRSRYTRAPPDMFGFAEVRGYSSYWLDDVLKKQHWPSLASVNLAGVFWEHNVLSEFLCKHSATLEEVRLATCEMRNESEVLRLVKAMHRDLENLEKCELDLDARWSFSHDQRELIDILDQERGRPYTRYELQWFCYESVSEEQSAHLVAYVLSERERTCDED